MAKFRAALVVAALAGLGLSACGHATKLTSDQTCQTGIYRLADGHLLDIAPAQGADLRWRLDNGRSDLLSAKDHWSSTLGWTGQPDGVSVRLPPCGGPESGRGITFSDPLAKTGGGQPIAGRRIPLQTQETTFHSGDLTLYGKLVTPAGAGPVPVIVETHGSEKDAATVFDFDQRMQPAQGVGMFVYDKRGTGRSTGKYTQDFQLLAQDAAAAAREARRLAGARLGRIGFAGGSQGGWVAPLAATLAPVDFVIVGYGLAGSPGEENTDQTVLELKRKGYGPADLAAAAEVAEATNAILASHFRGGFRQVAAVKARYHDRPWFKDLHGQFTGEIVKPPTWALQLVGPMFDVGTPAAYDAVPVLARVKAPMLWVLADDDTLAPNATTRQRLAKLIAEGQKITILAFPATDHGIMEFITTPKGERQKTRYADGYFRTTADWAKTGTLSPPYGASRVIGEPSPSPNGQGSPRGP